MTTEDGGGQRGGESAGAQAADPELAARATAALRKSLSFLGEATLAAQRAGGPTPLERFTNTVRRSVATISSTDSSLVALRADVRMRGYYKTEIQSIGSGGCLVVLGAAFFCLWLVWLALTIPWLLAVMAAHLVAIGVFDLVRGAVRKERLERIEIEKIGRRNLEAMEAAERLIADLNPGRQAQALAGRAEPDFKLVKAEFEARLTDTSNSRRTFAGVALLACSGRGCETLFVMAASSPHQSPSRAAAAAMAFSPAIEKISAIAAALGVTPERMELKLGWSPAPDGREYPGEAEIPSGIVAVGAEVMARTGLASWANGTVASVEGDGDDPEYVVETKTAGKVRLKRRCITVEDDGAASGIDTSGRYETFWSDEWWSGGFVTGTFGRASRMLFDEGTSAWVDASRIRRTGSKAGHYARKTAKLGVKLVVALALVMTIAYTFMLPDLKKAAQTRELKAALALAAPEPGQLLREAPPQGRTVFARFDKTEACYLAKILDAKPGKVELEFLDDKSIRWVGLDEWVVFGDCAAPGTRGLTPFGGGMKEAVIAKRDGLDIRLAIDRRAMRDESLRHFVIPYRDLLIAAPRRPVEQLREPPSDGDIVLSRRGTAAFCVAAIVLSRDTGGRFEMKYADGAEETRNLVDLFEDTLLTGCAVEAYAQSKSGPGWQKGVIAFREHDKVVVYLESGGSVEGNYSAVRVMLGG